MRLLSQTNKNNEIDSVTYNYTLMSLNLNGLKVLHPFDFLFQEQKDHIEYLNK